MDSNDSSTDKEDSGGTEMDRNTGHCGPSRDNAPEDEVGSNIKLQLKEVPPTDNEIDEVEHIGEEEEDQDGSLNNDDTDDIELKVLGTTEVKKNAGILHNEKNNHAPVTQSTTNNDDDDNDKSITSKDNANKMPALTQSPTILTCENDDKTQSSCISSPHSSTPGSTPPSTTVVGTAALRHDRSPTNSSANTPPTDNSTPKYSPESVPQSPSSNVTPLSLGNNCIQQPINIVRNGTIPNAGKPLLSTMSKKLERSTKTVRSRKPKSSVAMYESEVS